jgi:uncharacterized protein YwqG
MENQNNLSGINSQAEAPKTSYNPLMDVVSEKPYSVQNVEVDKALVDEYSDLFGYLEEEEEAVEEEKEEDSSLA